MSNRFLTNAPACSGHNKSRLLAWSLLAALAASIPPAARATQSVSLSWYRNTDSDVAGYVLYYGNTSGNYSTRVTVGTNTTTTVTGLKEGMTNYFAVTAYNSAGVESAPSGELRFIVPGMLKLTGTGKPGNPITMNFPVSPGHWYQILASTDLKHWTTIGQTTLSSSNAWTSFQDAQSTSMPNRFYRLEMH
jgi:Fibronectin type III domain